MEFNPPSVTLRHDFIGPRLIAWNKFLHRLVVVQLSHGPDEFHLSLTANGKFIVVSLYNALIQPLQLVINLKNLWRMKIPLKTKVLAYYVRRVVILTKDNLAKHN
jgi:hypothetical protein